MPSSCDPEIVDNEPNPFPRFCGGLKLPVNPGLGAAVEPCTQTEITTAMKIFAETAFWLALAMPNIYTQVP
jgi:hypothetical protein